MASNSFAVSVVPGQGVVARWTGGVAVAGGPPEVAGELIESLLQAIASTAEPGQIVDGMRNDERFSNASVNLALALETHAGVHVFVRGDGQVSNAQNESITGPEPTDELLEEAVGLWIGCTPAPRAQSHRVLDLQNGVVPGAGVVMHMRAEDLAASELHLVPEPSSPPVPSTFDSITFDEELPAREPLPVAGAAVTMTTERPDEEVLGVECSRNHFNNPVASYCQVCGISMVHLTRRLVPGPRPTLGFVVFGDGATYALDRSYLLGRQPKPGFQGSLHALVVQDVQHSVSREHARIDLDGWDVTYTDLGSTNGSFLWNSVQQRWLKLDPKVPCVLASGDSVSVGRASFTFERASRQIGQ